MTETTPLATSGSRRATTWIGRVLTAVIVLMFGMSAIMKIKGGPEVEKGMQVFGLAPALLMPLAILEITCVVVYALPATTVLGAILLTGYLGGAICTHWRVGDPFIVHIILGITVWLGAYLREPRLWSVVPIRWQ